MLHVSFPPSTLLGAVSGVYLPSTAFDGPLTDRRAPEITTATLTPFAFAEVGYGLNYTIEVCARHRARTA